MTPSDAHRRDLAAHSTTVHLTSVRRFHNEWERDASTRLRNRDTNVIDDYQRHGRLRPIWSDIADVVVANKVRSSECSHASTPTPNAR